MMKLSARLRKVAAYLPKGAYFADIGSDHAYLPCYVCLHDNTAKAIAGEVRQGPYNSAKKTVNQYHLNHAVDVRLGNGLQVVNKNDKIEQIVIAGMGGALIKDILEEGERKLTGIKRMIVQPNVGANIVRKWFLNHGFTITDEAIIEEGGHIYEIIIADKENKNSPYTKALMDKQLYFGPILLKEKPKAFYVKWRDELQTYRYVLDQMKQAKVKNREKITEYEQKITWMEEELQDEKNVD